MYKRLLDKKSIYDKHKYIKEYRQSQSYKKLSCKYPCIDFYKTMKISNFLENPTKKENLFINMKHKKYKKKTPYQKLFFSNEINIDNKKDKLFMDKVNVNIENQKKINEHIKMHYILKDYFEKKENNLNATFSNVNEKKFNNNKVCKTNKIKHNNNINIYRNSDVNFIAKKNFKDKNCFLIDDEKIFIT